MTTPSKIEIGKEFSEKLTVHKNLEQEVVVTTVDKVRLCLIKNQNLLSAKKEWFTPLGLFLALLTTLVAADFRDFILKQDTWTALYIIGMIISFCWLCCSGCRAWKNRAKSSIDGIVEELKTQQDKQLIDQNLD